MELHINLIMYEAKASCMYSGQSKIVCPPPSPKSYWNGRQRGFMYVLRTSYYSDKKHIHVLLCCCSDCDFSYIHVYLYNHEFIIMYFPNILWSLICVDKLIYKFKNIKNYKNYKNYEIQLKLQFRVWDVMSYRDNAVLPETQFVCYQNLRYESEK